MSGIMSIVTVVVLVFVGWPVAFFASSLYIICSPFGEFYKQKQNKGEIGFEAGQLYVLPNFQPFASVATRAGVYCRSYKNSFTGPIGESSLKVSITNSAVLLN